MNRVAVGGGSCGSMLAEAAAAGCDTFVTADVKYDQFLQAKAMASASWTRDTLPPRTWCAPLWRSIWPRASPGVRVELSKRHQEVYGSL